MNEQIIRQVCQQLMQHTDLVYVSTIGENGYPHTRAMNNLRNLKRFGSLAVFFNQQICIYLRQSGIASNRCKPKTPGVRRTPGVWT